MSFLPTPQAVCRRIVKSFSNYLDGAVSGREMQTIAAHLETCDACSQEFAGMRAMQEALSTLRSKAPDDLGLRLRLAISHEQAARRSSWRDTVSLHWENTLRPIALQASAGLACAVTLIGTIALLLGVVTPPNAVLANDEPLGAMTGPHYLYSVVRPRPIVIANAAGPAVSTIVIEAQVNADGRVFDYTVVSAPEGPDEAAVRSQIQDQLLLAVFEPASVFGVAVKGRVVLTFAGVSVRG